MLNGYILWLKWSANVKRLHLFVWGVNYHLIWCNAWCKFWCKLTWCTFWRLLYTSTFWILFNIVIDGIERVLEIALSSLVYQTKKKFYSLKKLPFSLYNVAIITLHIIFLNKINNFLERPAKLWNKHNMISAKKDFC